MAVLENEYRGFLKEMTCEQTSEGWEVVMKEQLQAEERACSRTAKWEIDGWISEAQRKPVWLKSRT